MKNLTSLVLALLGYASVFCQKVGIGTSSPGATLELYDGNSTGITNLFLARSNYNGLNPVDTVFTIYNNGNVRIGRSWPSPSGLVDIFGKMGDSVLLNLHGSPTMIFRATPFCVFRQIPATTISTLLHNFLKTSQTAPFQ